MRKKKGPWTVTGTRVVYKNPWLQVHEDAVIGPTGKKGTYSWVKGNDGVCVVALDTKGNVYLAREYRYGIGRVSLEAVSGGIEKGQTKLSAAKCELRQEAGITAKKWTYLGVYDALSSKFSNANHLYLAEDLSFGPQELEETEQITIVPMPFKRALDLVRTGTIRSAEVALALHMIDAILKKRR